MQSPESIVHFWFVEHGPGDWWSARPELDRAIADRFAATHASIAAGEGFSWRDHARGRLAEIIVLDQFSRQLFRASPRAFAQDGMALVLAQEAVAGGADQDLPPDLRTFLYMPFMHAESLVVQDAAEALFAALGDDNVVKAAVGHRDCIRRFGRFPKRNAVLGRISTPAEIAYLAEVGDRMF